MSNIWCRKCGSDTDGVHYGSCPDHPNNQALANRVFLPPKQPSPDNQQTPTRASTKADWFTAPSDITFSPNQMKNVLEYFLHNVMDLQGIEVIQVKSTIKGTKVTFKKKEIVHEEEPEVVESGEVSSGDSDISEE